MKVSMLSSRRRCHPIAVDPLESRRLMSGSWNTVYSDPSASWVPGLAADHNGNVYGISNTDSGSYVGNTWVPNYTSTVMKETAGQWTKVLSQSNAAFDALTVDGAGNAFIGGSTISADGSQHWAIWELPAGTSTLSLIDTSSSKEAGAFGIGVDSAGDVYADGTQTVTTTTTTTSHGKTTTTTTNTVYDIIRKLVPTIGGFSGATLYQNIEYLNGSVTFDTGVANNLSVIDSGPSAGVYVVGTDYSLSSDHSRNVDHWDVLKSSDDGATWSLVDHFNSDPNLPASAYAVTGDGLGNVYVAGTSNEKVLTGYTYTTTKVKGQIVTTATPHYNYFDHWIVRSSATGNSGSWSTSDDFLASGVIDSYPYAIGADPAGNIYVAGGNLNPGANSGSTVLRTNAGGSWSTSDTFDGPSGSQQEYAAFAADSEGNLFAGGGGLDAVGNYTGAFIRSMPVSTPAPAAPTTNLFSTSAISSSTLASDVLGGS
jgi:hypothetical protein